jgi:glucose/arabinose dehydrogenase
MFNSKSLLLSISLLMHSLISYSQSPSISIQPFASGFSSPVDVTHCGDSRIFVVEQDGYIRIITDSGMVQATPFLNIDNIVLSGGEQGLLGLAFHPNYKQNGYFYVYFTNNSGNLAISRFSVSAADSNLADAASQLNIITVPHPTNSNHNGGCLRFGPDGYLYIGTGDGGGGGDVPNNAQNPAKWLGKMLRLDIDNGTPYLVPPDNPYINSPGYFPEIWAVGLRNPWRFSFDKLNGDLWIGDVGQGLWEEVDYVQGSVTAQHNFGWRCYEGNHPYNTSGCQPQANYDSAVYELAHSPGGYCSVVGGYVYRGGKYGKMFGYYFFGDYCNDTIHVLKKNPNGTFSHYTPAAYSAALGAFGEDYLGNVYVTNLNNGNVRKIVSNDCTPTAFVAEEDTVRVCADSIRLESPFAPAQVYSWTTPSGTTSGNSVWVTQSGWVNLTVINQSACLNKDSAYIEILGAPPIPTITGIDPVYCGNQAINDTLIGSPSGGIFSGPGISGNVFNPVAAGVGQFNINYLFTDSNLCKSSSSQVLTVAAPPATSISGLDTIYCSNLSPADTIIGLPSGGIFSGTGMSSNVFNPAGIANGSYVITYQYVDSNNCTGSSSQNVAVEFCSGITQPTSSGLQISNFSTSAGNLEIGIKCSFNSATEYQVTDYMGRIMASGKLFLKEGEQRINVPVKTDSGIYFWTLRSNKHTVTLRFVIAD